MGTIKNIIEQIVFENGMEIDREESWRKLPGRQFGGKPERAFGELVQNAYDGYNPTVEWQDRRLEIQTGRYDISITDYGVGMGRVKLKLLVTLGGTDKVNDKSKMGQFGIGFSSMFNSYLGVTVLDVHTMCEGHPVELTFTVIEPGKIPEIKTRILDEPFPFSTRITAHFDNTYSSANCLEHARECLRSFPCKVTMNGEVYSSIWEEAERTGRHIFKSGACMGFVEPGGWYGSSVKLLRRFETISELSIESLMTGGHGIKFDARDWARKRTPYVDDVSITINCNDLNVPISRDGFYLDAPYHRMVAVVNEQMMIQLGNKLKHHQDQELIIINHYTLRYTIRDYINLKLDNEPTEAVNPVIKTLAKANVYPINGKSKKYSLLDIALKRTKELPIFYSPAQTNLRWLGGAFKHDFIVLPPWRDRSKLTAPDFYPDIFKTVFKDTINLDTIEYDYDKMAQLVKQGVINQESLSPNVRLTKIRRLDNKEQACVDKIDRILSHDSVRKAIARNLNIKVSKVRSAFFELEDSDGVIATGFLDENGKPLTKDFYSNLGFDGETQEGNHPKPILLGLQKDNALIESLIEINDPYMPYFLMIFLTNELVLCQKLLLPASPYFHVVKARLAKDMRLALIDQLLEQRQIDTKIDKAG